jgi:hypothetical protein
VTLHHFVHSPLLYNPHHLAGIAKKWLKKRGM